MQEMTIKISIITVCYNAEDTIEETVKSVVGDRKSTRLNSSHIN